MCSKNVVSIYKEKIGNNRADLQGQAGVRASTHALITVALFLSFLAFAVPGRILFKHRVPVHQMFKNHYCKRIFNDQERHPRNDNQIRKESVCCVFGEKKKICVQKDIGRLYMYQTLIEILFVQIVNYF